MAAIGEHVKNEELNHILKRIGERGIMDEKLKVSIENVKFHNLQQLSNESSQKGIMFRLYGSAAEDLMCTQPNDAGDVDIVIFPNSDNLMIHEEMIEYLPENPMHVKIKGADHPVLQSCLVEGTEYVATSALKNFHPAIYGSAMHFFDNLSSFFAQVLSRKECSPIIQVTHHFKNNTTSPAATLNSESSYDFLMEGIEMLSDGKNLAYLDPNSWEWLVYCLCNASHTDFTRALTEVLKEMLDFVKDLTNSLPFEAFGTRILPELFCALLQKIFSPAQVGLETRLSPVEGSLQPVSTRGIENWSDDEAMHDRHNATRRGQEDCSQRTLPRLPSESSSQPQHSDYIHSFAGDSSQKSKTRDPPEVSVQFPAGKWIPIPATELSQDVNDKSEDKKDEKVAKQENPNEAKPEEQHSLAMREKRDSKEQPRNINVNQENKAREQDRRIDIRNHWSEHPNRPVTETKARHKVVSGTDYVPALKSRQWPKAALEWIKRQRKWPSYDVVDKVIQEGFHLVVKAPRNGGDRECDFRLSFANAEYLLSQEMNEIQRECYRCLKKYHRAYLSTEPKSLVTFHLKNLLLQTIEETGTEVWTESNRAECMMKLLGNLMVALRKNDLRHFFVRSYNLFSVDYIENPKILESLAGQVEQIIENPLWFAKKLIQTNTDGNKRQVKKEQFVSSNELTPSAEPAATRKELDCTQVKRTPPTRNDREQMEVTFQGPCSSTSYRYHELKESYLSISKELTDIALAEDESNSQMESLGAQERSLVGDLKEIGKIHNIQVDDFAEMFDRLWNVVCFKVWFSNELTMKRRVLLGIQGVIEMYKYLLRQDDYAPGNEQALIRRMLDPTVTDPFDFSHVHPVDAVKQLICRIYYKLKSRRTKPETFDDIPL